MKKVFETPYSLVTEKNGVIYVKAKTRIVMVITLFGLILGLFAYLLSQSLTADGGMEQFCFWAAIIILPLSGLILHHRPPSEFKSITIFDITPGKCKRLQVYDFRKFNGLLWKEAFW